MEHHSQGEALLLGLCHAPLLVIGLHHSSLLIFGLHHDPRLIIGLRHAPVLSFSAMKSSGIENFFPRVSSPHK